MPAAKRTNIKTNAGHILTLREDKFIDNYLELGNARQAVIKAGYTTKTPEVTANNLLLKSYIVQEIQFRQQQEHSKSIAKGDEVMEYLSAVMRGEIKDQFGLDTPVSERTKAAVELARRTVDIDNRLAGKEDATIKVKLDWGD